jgi:predicted XRE-type DNA-binding protein
MLWPPAGRAVLSAEAGAACDAHGMGQDTTLRKLALLNVLGDAAMKKAQLETVRGSGNIYRDFDVPDADVRQLKAILAAEIIKALDKKGVRVHKAQSLTGIDAGDFSRVRNADFRRISVERLMAMINGLGSRVEVAVKISRAEVRHAAVAP